VLRDEWGFDGLVVSDWGAVHDRVAALAAGLDLEMPPNLGVSDAPIVAAVRAGELDEAVLDTAVARGARARRPRRAAPGAGRPASTRTRTTRWPAAARGVRGAAQERRALLPLQPRPATRSR
jgi:beta-glucosidase